MTTDAFSQNVANLKLVSENLPLHMYSKPVKGENQFFSNLRVVGGTELKRSGSGPVTLTWPT